MEQAIKITVHVPKTIIITPAEKQMIESLGNVKQDSRIYMIKFIKNQYDVDLTTAKAVVDLIVGHTPPDYLNSHVPGTTTLGELLRAKLG